MKRPRLSHKFSFQKRIEQGNDGLGNILSEWVEQFEVRADRKWLRGGEEVLAARLSGTQPAVITVRANKSTEQVTSFWRCVDVNTGITYNVMTNEPWENRLYIDMMIKSGVPDG